MVGIIIYSWHINNKKKKEILKLKFKLKKAAQIIKRHDPNFRFKDNGSVASFNTQINSGPRQPNDTVYSANNKGNHFGTIIEEPQEENRATNWSNE